MKKHYQYSSVIKYGIMSEDEFITEMDLLGDDGWELITVLPPTNESYLTAYFKRQNYAKDIS